MSREVRIEASRRRGEFCAVMLRRRMALAAAVGAGCLLMAAGSAAAQAPLPGPNAWNVDLWEWDANNTANHGIEGGSGAWDLMSLNWRQNWGWFGAPDPLFPVPSINGPWVNNPSPGPPWPRHAALGGTANGTITINNGGNPVQANTLSTYDRTYTVNGATPGDMLDMVIGAYAVPNFNIANTLTVNAIVSGTWGFSR